MTSFVLSYGICYVAWNVMRKQFQYTSFMPFSIQDLLEIYMCMSVIIHVRKSHIFHVYFLLVDELWNGDDEIQIAMSVELYRLTWHKYTSQMHCHSTCFFVGWKPENHLKIFRNWVSILHSEHCIATKESYVSIMHGKVFSIYSGNRTKHIHVPRGKSTEFLVVKLYGI
jgi:hypothetical protein